MQLLTVGINPKPRSSEPKTPGPEKLACAQGKPSRSRQPGKDHPPHSHLGRLELGFGTGLQLVEGCSSLQEIGRVIGSHNKFIGCAEGSKNSPMLVGLSEFETANLHVEEC